MSDPKKPQTSSASVNAAGDANIGGDVIGRDKIETHQHIQQAPSDEQIWETWEVAGRRARTVHTLGIIIMVGGVLLFVGGFLLAGVNQDFNAGPATGALIYLGGCGGAIVGLITTSIGWTMARHDFFRQRRNTRR